MSEAQAILVRDAAREDAPALLRIYAHHVANGFGSFEETPPDDAEMLRRFDGLSSRGYPWHVAVVDGDVLGYAYASPFRPRSAYRFTVEDSVYVAPEATRRGVGAMLLKTLIARCEAMGFRQMIAAIGDSGNVSSIGLHRAYGFEIECVLRSVGFKRGRWLDLVVMRRALGAGDAAAPTGAPLRPAT